MFTLMDVRQSKRNYANLAILLVPFVGWLSDPFKG